MAPVHAENVVVWHTNIHLRFSRFPTIPFSVFHSRPSQFHRNNVRAHVYRWLQNMCRHRNRAMLPVQMEFGICSEIYRLTWLLVFYFTFVCPLVETQNFASVSFGVVCVETQNLRLYKPYSQTFVASILFYIFLAN